MNKKALLNKTTAEKKGYSVFVIRQYLRMATLTYKEETPETCGFLEKVWKRGLTGTLNGSKGWLWVTPQVDV